jgi:hypothetical protein
LKQIYYLTVPERFSRFDALFNELDFVVYPQDIRKVKSLVAFVNREKTLHQMDYILIDLIECDYSQEHILSAVQLLRRFSVADLIFLSPAGEETDLLFGRLAGFRLSGLIAVDSDTDPQAELRACLNDEGGNFTRRASALQAGMAAEAVRKAVPLRIPTGLVISVAVAGAQSRVGVTTQCFALYHYLKTLGFRPAILDGERRDLDILAAIYEKEMEQRQGYVVINGIPFCTEMVEGLDAYLLDLGVLRPETAAQFSGQDLSVLVSGAKPWELPHLADALKLVGKQPRQLVTLISFATQKDMERIGKYLGEHAANVPYHPDIWEAGSTAAYRDAILPCLKAICGGGDA